MLSIWILCGMVCFLYFFSKRRIGLYSNGKKFDLKLEAVLEIALFFGLICLMTANRSGYDAISFNRFFSYVKLYGKNPFDYTYGFFLILVKFILNLFPEMTYQMFEAAVIAVIGFFLIRPVFRKYQANAACVMSLYALSGMVAVDGMQFKNFLAVSFLVGAIGHLFQEGKRNVIRFYILVTISVLFHFSFAIYYFLPLIKLNGVKKISGALPVAGGIGYLFLLLDNERYTAGILSFISRIGILSKVEDYDGARAGIQSMVPVLIYFMIFLILEYFKHGRTDDLRGMTKKLLENAIYLWRLIGVLLPFLCYANASYRLFRNFYIILFMVMAKVVLEEEKSRAKRYVNGFLVIALAFVIFMYVYLLHQQIDIYIPVVEGDFFWETGKY